MTGNVTDVEVRIRYHCFLMCLFQSVQQEVVTLCSMKRKNDSEATLATLWRDHLEEGNIREEFYTVVTENAQNALKVRYSISLSSWFVLRVC